MSKTDRELSIEFWCIQSNDNKLMYISLIEKYSMIKITLDDITEEQIELIWSINNA